MDHFCPIEQATDAVGHLNESTSLQTVKQVITVCNSMTIRLFQHGLFDKSAFFLEKAFEADGWIIKSKNYSLISWAGRMLVRILKAFYLYKQGMIQDCLQQLWNSHEIALRIKGIIGSASADLMLAAHLMTFVGLWKIQKFKEAQEYANNSKIALKFIAEHINHSKLSRISIDNLKGLCKLNIIAVKLKIQGDFNHACRACSQLTLGMGDELTVRSLIKQYMKRTKDLSSPDALINKEYESILLLSVLVPLIEQGTPDIHKKDIEFHRSPPSRPIVFKRSKKINIPLKIQIKRNGKRSSPKRTFLRHWWAHPQTVNNILQKSLSKKPTEQRRSVSTRRTGAVLHAPPTLRCLNSQASAQSTRRYSVNLTHVIY